MDDLFLYLWIIAFVAGIAYTIIRIAIAMSRAKKWNREQVPQLRAVLEALRGLYGPFLFVIPTVESTYLLISEQHIHYLYESIDNDVLRTQITRSEHLQTISELEVVQGISSAAIFRITYTGGPASQKFTTTSLAELTRLFNLMLDLGREVRFVKS